MGEDRSGQRDETPCELICPRGMASATPLSPPHVFSADPQPLPGVRHTRDESCGMNEPEETGTLASRLSMHQSLWKGPQAEMASKTVARWPRRPDIGYLTHHRLDLGLISGLMACHAAEGNRAICCLGGDALPRSHRGKHGSWPRRACGRCRGPMWQRLSAKLRREFCSAH